jgi:hypothetical protein
MQYKVTALQDVEILVGLHVRVPQKFGTKAETIEQFIKLKKDESKDALADVRGVHPRHFPDEIAWPRATAKNGLKYVRDVGNSTPEDLPRVCFNLYKLEWWIPNPPNADPHSA